MAASNFDAFSFISYALVIFMLTYLIVRWRHTIKLEKEKRRFEQLVKEKAKEISEKNQQLEKQTLQLKYQADKLKEMDMVKSRFFANISHEFRTPLTLIMSPLEKMLSICQDKEQKKELNVMLRNSQRLLTLVNQLLDLSRFDSGKMKLQAANQNIVPFLKGILASFDILARQNRLTLEFLCGEEKITLYFDPSKMEEMMINLIINAIKFTPTGGKITVSVFKDQQRYVSEGTEIKGCIKISVQDTGIGISSDQLPHIFNRFYQGENTKECARVGTGIGLALTKEIVLLHHGKINVHTQEGIGTEFEILLPLGHEHLKPNEIAEPSSYKKKEFQTFYIDDEEEIYVYEEDETVQGKNIILVVEDNLNIRRYICDSLKPEYRVVEAGNGNEGIEKAKEIIPDLIISNIMMPEKDGYELCRELKKDVNTGHIPIILLTAKASEESIIQGLENGADDYVFKPFNTKIMLNRIKNLIELRRQLQLKIQRKKMLLPTEISVSSPDEVFLKEFQEIIEKNLSDQDFNVDVLCRKLIIGRSTLFRRIQALTGETPNDFILSYRLERAAQLLRNNYGNVTEVAMEVGFSSSDYFSKCFKKRFHQSPISYQKLWIS